MGKPGFEDVMLGAESDTAAYGGQFAKARELTRRASDSAQRADEKETAAGYEAEAAVREALVGNMSLAKQQAQAALALSTGRDVEAVSAIALGSAGDALQATRLAEDLAKRFPEDTIVQFEYLPMIHAGASLGSGNATKALEALAPAAPYELGSMLRSDFALYPVYLRGEAYVAAHQGRRPQPSSRKFSTTRASSRTSQSARWRTWAWRVPTPSPVTPPKRRAPTRTSSPSGKTPTPTFPS